MPSVAGETSPSDGGFATSAAEQNGVSDADSKTRENSWGLGDMRQNAADWSLASDAGLLKYLQEFSSKLTLKAHESTQRINNLVHDTRMTDAKLRNVTDRFLTLSDSQFIENRVYDEDMSAETNGNEAKVNGDAKENAEPKPGQDVDTTPKLAEAISYGIKVLDDAFDILDANAANSDFDSDMDSDVENGDASDGAPQPAPGIYEAKDPYVARPLPHLIGSRGFHELDDVGVADIPSDDEAQDDQGSMSESEEEEEEVSPPQKNHDASSSESSDYDSDPESSESEGDVVKRKPTLESKNRSEFSSDSGDDKNLFGKESDGDEDDSHSDAPPEVTRNPTPKPSHKKSHKQKKEKDPFDDDDDDDEDLFASSGGLFGTGSNLFSKKKKDSGGLFGDIEDEEEDEDSSKQDEGSQRLSSDEDEDPPEKPSMEKKLSKPAKKTYGGVSLFGGAVNKEMFKKLGKDDDSEERSRTGSQASGQSSKKNLFDSSDDDDGLFQREPPSMTKPTASPASSKSSKKETKSLFDSSESEVEKPAPTPKKKPKSSVSAKKKAAPDLFASDSDDDGDLFSGGISQTKSAKSEKKKTASPTTPHKESTSAKSKKPLPSSSEDDMFSEKPPPPEMSSSAPKKGGLFDEDSDDDFFAPKQTNEPKTAKNRMSIFSDSDSDDMFSSAPKSKTTAQSVKEAPVPSSKPKSESNADHHSGSLFSDPEPAQEDDDITDDNPPIKEEPRKKKLAGAVPMFMGAMGGNELAAAISKRRADSEVSTKSSASSKAESEDTANKMEESRAMAETDDAPPKAATNISHNILQNTTAKPFKPPQLGNVTARPFKPAKPSTNTPKPVLHKSEPSATNKKSVSALGAKLAIDPKTLLPGAAPKPTPVLPTEISFDKPPVLRTLDSVNKTRSRGQANRRPPSRQKRMSQVDPDVSAERMRAVSPATTPMDKPKSVEREKGSEKPKTVKKEVEPDVVTEEMRAASQAAAPVEKPKRAKQEKSVKPKTAEKEDDMFSLSPEPKKSKSVLIMDNTDDFDAELFSGSLFGQSKKTSDENKAKSIDKDLFADDDEEDIFGDTKQAPSADKKIPAVDDSLFGGSTNAQAKRPGTKAPKLFDDDDDIFGGVDFLKTTTTPEKKDDDDIFGDDLDFTLPTSLAKDDQVVSIEVGSGGLEKDGRGFGLDRDGSAEPEAKTEPKATSPNIFSDDGDIFGDDPMVITSGPKAKPGATGGLFGDDGAEDIFAEATKKEPAGAKAKKPTKKQAKTTKVKSIFDDDDNLDDIFLSSASKKTTKKKKTMKSSGGGQTKKSAKTKPAPAETTSNIFDDPLSMP